MTTVRAHNSARPSWAEKPSLLMNIVKGIVIAAIVLVMVYPILYVLALSVSVSEAPTSIFSVLAPGQATLGAYQAVFAGGVVTRALFVSVGITIVGTALAVAITTLLAYGLTRTSDVPGSKFVLYLVLFSMLFAAGIIPNFLLVKELGMLNSFSSLILPGALSAFNLVVLRNFFMELPKEIFESARLDGASEFQILMRIVVPLSKGVIAVIALFYAVSIWSDFFSALLYVSNSDMWPLAMVIRQYVVSDSQVAGMAVEAGQLQANSQAVQMATVCIATIPILIVYPFFQRFFAKGVLTGAVKG